MASSPENNLEMDQDLERDDQSSQDNVNMEPCHDQTKIDYPQGDASLNQDLDTEYEEIGVTSVLDGHNGNGESAKEEIVLGGAPHASMPSDSRVTCTSRQLKAHPLSDDPTNKVIDTRGAASNQDVSMEPCDDTTAIDDPLQGDANLKQDQDTIFQKTDINIVLVGHAGNGKSATGNTILGGKLFKSMPSASSVTLTCEKKSTQLSNGRPINVIDTQGFGDIVVTDHELIIEELTKCFDLANNEIHAILLVVSVRSRFSKEEAAAIRNLKTILGTNVVNYVIVVFTGGDDLENQSKTLDDYLGHDCPDPLKEIIRICGERCILFDNRTKSEEKKDEQIQQLLSQIDEMINNNGGHPFKHSLYELQQRVNELSDNTTQLNSHQGYPDKTDDMTTSGHEQAEKQRPESPNKSKHNLKPGENKETEQKKPKSHSKVKNIFTGANPK